MAQSSSLKHLCIHGHFYQPPREDPFIGIIPSEAGADPYQNWNERIHAECYLPNAQKGNFRKISFNLGPTLSAWMYGYDPATCKEIASQDRQNVHHLGVGNAMAQAYNHTILPLATRQDKVTQVFWGIVDFEHRFGRKPQGMWLPETGVDLETLSVLAELGIEFTILAPWQAETSQLDVTEPYQVNLPDGRQIAIFFFHRALSAAISFDPALTANADIFVEDEVLREFSAEKERRGEAQLVLIASDGELYGHHQHFRDLFLAHLVDGASSKRGLELTFPAYWLKHFPPRREITLRENTSWSCHHGVTRWKGSCPCTPGDGAWKVYFRQALDRLAESLDRLYVEEASALQLDPWKLRNHLIYVMLGKMSMDALIQEQAGRVLPTQQAKRLALSLNAQKERQRMFTSCGWYFEDFNRLESKYNLAYAAQAVWLARQATGVDLSPELVSDLRHVVSHRTGLRGDAVFMRQMEVAEQMTRNR